MDDFDSACHTEAAGVVPIHRCKIQSINILNFYKLLPFMLQIMIKVVSVLLEFTIKDISLQKIY